MRNVLIPLDILFINKELKIVAVKKSFKPCIETPCPSFEPPGYYQYVLEVNAGFSDMHQINIGDRVRVKLNSPE